MMYPIIMSGAPRMKKIVRLSYLQLRKGRRTVKKAPTTYGGTVWSCCETTESRGYIVLTMVGAKKARPCTVILSSRKMKEVAIVTGLKRPFAILAVSTLSSTSFWPTRSDLTRAMARSFSAWVSQRAVSGRSVSVTKEISARQQVTMPSIAKIILQRVREPKESSVRIADANNPPKAPARGAMTMYSDSLKASSERLYQRDI